MRKRNGIILFRDPIHLSASRYQGEFWEDETGIWFYVELINDKTRRTFIPWSNIRCTVVED